ncbi:TolC family protein [Oscillatoria laete-virens NRMC-F 0139]|nr:TolC family protein [Oscillatoria laete-virens]MDL5054117.1 TolC family protein [Oscillatoria laete-virens NRMC-F 0139]
MMFHSNTIIVALSMTLALSCVAEDAPPRPPSLLEAHLRQAEVLQLRVPDQSLEKLESFQREMTERARSWEKRVQADEPLQTLLEGLPKHVIDAARSANSDNKKTIDLLQSDSSLAQILALVAIRSPDVRVARESLRASLRRFEQAAYLEDLVGQFRAFARELDTRVGPQSHKEMPEKTFAFPSILALKGQIIDQEASIAELQYQRALRMALNEAARAYFEAQNARQSFVVLKESRELFANMEGLARERLRVGQAAQSDLLKAQAELAMLDNQLVTLERQHANTQTKINSLLSLPPESEWKLKGSIDLRDTNPSLEQTLADARLQNHENLVAAREPELMASMVRMAETDLLPRASLGYSRLAPSAGAEAGPTRSAMAAFPDKQEVNASRAGFGSNAAYLEELRTRVAQSNEMKSMLLAQTEFNVKDAHFKADSARRERTTLSEVVVPKARQALETVRENYNAAKVPFIEYLDAARSYLKDILELEKARLEHNQMIIELQERRGRSAIQVLPDSK